MSYDHITNSRLSPLKNSSRTMGQTMSARPGATGEKKNKIRFYIFSLLARLFLNNHAPIKLSNFEEQSLSCRLFNQTLADIC